MTTGNSTTQGAYKRNFEFEGSEKTKAALDGARRGRSKYLVEAARVIARMTNDNPEANVVDLLRWLRTTAEFSYNDAHLLARAHHRISANGDQIVRSDLSPDLLHIIARSDDRTWAEFFARLEHGEKADPRAAFAAVRETLGAVATLPQMAHLSLLQQLEADRPWLWRSLRDKARQLLPLFNEVNDLYVEYRPIWEHEEEVIDEVSEDPRYADIRREIAMKALEVRTLFEVLFGSEHIDRADVLDHSLENDFEASVAMAWHALNDLVDGFFFVLDFSLDRSIDLRLFRECMMFLSGAVHRVVQPPSRSEKVSTFPGQRLAMVDIAASLGGAALGLESAGFQPTGLYEYWNYPQTVMLRNRKDWPVKELPSVFDPKQLFADHVGKVHLLTSGTTMRPRSRHDRSASPSSLGGLGHAAQAVETVRPTAFFFVMDPDFLAGEVDSKRADFERRFTAIGYELTRHVVKASLIGLPHDASYGVLIGMLDGKSRLVRMPVVGNPMNTSLGDAIGNMIKDSIERDASSNDTPSAPTKRYKDWKRKHAANLTPMLLDWKSSINQKKWRDLGIHWDGGYSNSDQALACMPPDERPFRLTRDMLKVLQGFPSDWNVDSDLPPMNQPFQTAVPPVLAKFVGLAIYSAITGETVDTERLLAEPLRTKQPLNTSPEYGWIVIARGNYKQRRYLVWAPLLQKKIGENEHCGLRRPSDSTQTKHRDDWRRYWEPQDSVANPRDQ